MLFILNYRSYKDNAVNELFASITKNRKEILAESKGRIYFILNQVDLKSERDPAISETIKRLRKELTGFGFPEPIVFPVSALQALLAKLIQQNKATEEQKKDFKRFFSAQYSEENEDGDMIIPAPRKIAPKAVQDSGIIAVQEAVFQTIVETAGWNLLSDVLKQLDKAAGSIEDTLNTQIAGWEKTVEELGQIVHEYKKKRNSAEDKIKKMKKGVEEHKTILIKDFGESMDAFVQTAKDTVQEAIDTFNQRGYKPPADPIEATLVEGVESVASRLDTVGELFFPSRGLKVATKKIIQLGGSLLDILKEKGVISSASDPYIIQCSSQEDLQRTLKTIIRHFAIRDWWVDYRDEFIRGGEKVREKLVAQIQNEIQGISDELSQYLGESLQVKININLVQFPGFEFEGIDKIIAKQKELIRDVTKEKKFLLVFPYDDPRFEVNLKDIAKKIKAQIDKDVRKGKQEMEPVVQEQVDKDFASAEKQISDYMEKFRIELEKIISKKARKEENAPKEIEFLKENRTFLEEHLEVLSAQRTALDAWKPRV